MTVTAPNVETAQTSNTDPPILTITVHLADGRRPQFLIQDLAVATNLLEKMNPARLFNQNLLILGNESGLTAFPVSHVVRVDFESSLIRSYAYIGGVSRVLEVSKEDWELSRDRIPKTVADRELAARQGNIAVNAVEIELSNRDIVYLEIHVALEEIDVRLNQRTTFDGPTYLNNLFAGHGVHAERNGGMMVVNPTRIVRFASVPGPPVVPASVWNATPV